MMDWDVSGVQQATVSQLKNCSPGPLPQLLV